MTTTRRSDYSLTGKDTAVAIENGLAEATWYASPVPRHKMRELLERSDGPAMRDTLLWFALILGCGVCGFMLWDTGWAILPFMAYGVLYASTSDSRWHEAGHGTAFKTDWMNNVLLHSTGRLSPDERAFIPESEYGKVVIRARIYVVIYASVVGLSVYTRSILPLMYIGLPALYGSWLQFFYGHTQHAGLAENVLDHRLNSRTIYMHAIHRYLYWNMNYHVAEDFYAQAIDLEKKIGIPVSHETHRRRYFATPWQTRHIMQRFPDLRITCDFSHWVCVCERLLPDMGETISLAAQHCHHLHARVGYAEGPQVPDPSAPEYATQLAAHEAWCEQVWQSQRERGFLGSTLTPEFGPPPYLQTLPYTNVPVADLVAVCDWMAKRQRERFARVQETVSP